MYLGSAFTSINIAQTMAIFLFYMSCKYYCNSVNRTKDIVHSLRVLSLVSHVAKKMQQLRGIPTIKKSAVKELN